ncbi:MAG: PDZ domain-containing protein, partial [Planctomycetaceae bacterium]|nr:PDZ domain-containing protein [Planctomycetaceae bacterium]
VETGQKSARNSATLELDGDRIAWDESEQETFFNIVIEENSQFGTKEVDLLRRLPGSLQISFVKRDMSPTVLEALKTVNSLQYIALVNCRYDLEPMFGLWKERPDLVISASGNEAFLGVQLDSRIAFETQQVCGVLEVIPNSAAAAAGIQAGDLFLRVNGIPVSRSEEVILAIGAFKPGDTLTLDLIRDEKEREMQIELRARPEEQ